jgi:signal peptidase II
MSGRTNLTFGRAGSLMLFVGLVDQLSKQWVVERLGEVGESEVICPYFNIALAMNKGITFGLLNHIKHDYVTYALIAVAAVVVFLLGRWLWMTTSNLVSYALGLIIGGAVGNVIDRVHYGAVVDFLDFHINQHHWYTFNIADATIVTGVSILLLDSLVRPR